VIFGAGQVGSQLAARLVTAGRQVRVVRRSAAPATRGTELEVGDIADPGFAIHAARGADAVYHCVNPPYSTREWVRLVPLYMSNLIDAAGTAGARLVVLDNLYMLGKPNGRRFNEDSPTNPCSRKGEIRARATELLFDAHRRGAVRMTSGRASDFYGPGGRLTNFGSFLWRPALAGGTGRVVMPLDAVHTYHYIPDVAAGLHVLGTAQGADVEGRWWMLPCQPAGTARQLINRLAAALGQPLRVTELPGWIAAAMGLFMPFMRELREMRYQWQEPFICDDRRFRERFAAEPTSPDEAARATVAWASAAYGPSPASAED
jgi:nucleoside-diphosphate-sugar epimerase